MFSLFRLTPPSDDAVRSFLSRQHQSHFSYSEVGASAGQLPEKYNIDHNRIHLGRGEAAWRQAEQVIRAWEMFTMPWVRVYPPAPAIQVGINVVVSVQHFGFYSLNACRVVYVVDEDGPVKRFGFAYGTLVEHAEGGEERFTIEWNRTDDTVSYDILVFSRPRRLLARLAYPMSRSLQKRFRNDSMAAMLHKVGSPNISPESTQSR